MTAAQTAPAAADDAGETFDRVMRLEGVGNLRDYGGYPTTDGRKVRRGRLFRSAHHGGATDADLEVMAGLGCTTIVDLRRRSERERDPSRRHANFDAVVIDNDLGDVGTAPHLAFLATGRLSEESIREFMIHEYERIPFEERHLDLYRRYFAALAEGRGPVLIHCAAGKDRTGLLAALTHHLLGVSADDTLADYLLTNTAGHIDARAPEIAATMAQTYGRPFGEATVRAFMGVEAIYLETAWRVIEARYGSVDAYLDQALGVTPERRARIVANLIE